MYPLLGSDEEYGFYVEHCYPIEDDRRQYFQNLAQRADPHVGYRILALLGETGLISSTWTANFDRLVAKAIDAMLAKVTPIEKQCSNHMLLAAPLRNKILAIGLVDDVKDAFGEAIQCDTWRSR